MTETIPQILDPKKELEHLYPRFNRVPPVFVKESNAFELISHSESPQEPWPDNICTVDWEVGALEEDQ